MLRRIFSSNTVPGLVFSGLFFLSTSLFAGPRVEEIGILSVQANGSGCPVGSTTELIVDTEGDGTADFFQVTFSDFYVEKPGIPSKNCLVEVLLDIPQGWRFSMAQVHYEGYAEISRIHRGRISTSYEFPFFSNRVTTRKVLGAGFNGEYKKQDTLGLFTAVYSRCGVRAPLNMNTRISLSGPNRSYSFLGLERQTGLLTQIWAIQWKRC